MKKIPENTVFTMFLSMWLKKDNDWDLGKKISNILTFAPIANEHQKDARIFVELSKNSQKRSAETKKCLKDYSDKNASKFSTTFLSVKSTLDQIRANNKWRYTKVLDYSQNQSFVDKQKHEKFWLEHDKFVQWPFEQQKKRQIF